MRRHETQSKYGMTLAFETPTEWSDAPLSVRVGTRSNEALVKREDAIKLRDMLIEALGAPEPEAPKATTSKVGEPVRFEASNGYVIIDRSPFGLKVLDRLGVEKYNVGTYTITALREYFDRPYVAPRPTLWEQFAALKIGARFQFLDNPGRERVKVSPDKYYGEGAIFAINIQPPSQALEEITDDA